MKISQLVIIFAILAMLLTACGSCDPSKDGYTMTIGNWFDSNGHIVSYTGFLGNELTVKNTDTSQYTYSITVGDGKTTIPVGNKNIKIEICNSYMWFQP